MAEFTGTATVSFTGDYELDLSKLTDHERMEIREALDWARKYPGQPAMVTIPIVDLEFETEVTIEVEPDGNDWRD